MKEIDISKISTSIIKKDIQDCNGLNIHIETTRTNKHIQIVAGDNLLYQMKLDVYRAIQLKELLDQFINHSGL